MRDRIAQGMPSYTAVVAELHLKLDFKLGLMTLKIHIIVQYAYPISGLEPCMRARQGNAHNWLAKEASHV